MDFFLNLCVLTMWFKFVSREIMTYEKLIQDPDYSLIEILEHSKIKSLIIKEFKINRGWSRIAMVYQFIGMIVFAFFLTFTIISELKHDIQTNLIYLGFGTLFSLTILIVIHELIHAVAYLLTGARQLSFGMQIKKFIFYVISDKEVLNYHQFKIVALAPALVISILSLTALLIFNQQPVFYYFLPIFGLHSIFCTGDFGLLCFFQNRSHQEILTFDVKSEGKTYFYGKEKNIIK